MNLANATNNLLFNLVSSDIKWRTLGWSHTNVISINASKDSIKNRIWTDIEEYILNRNLSFAINAVNLLQLRLIWNNTCKFTLKTNKKERNMFVKSKVVTSSTYICVIWENINKNTKIHLLIAWSKRNQISLILALMSVVATSVYFTNETNNMHKCL